eukprot:3751943-Alexandrium_andersonii.AAC.1
MAEMEEPGGWRQGGSKLEGIVFVDGSADGPTAPTRRAGWACWSPGQDLAVSGGLPGQAQSAARAELYAVARALELAGEIGVLATDNL